ncbi:MAG: recombinase family protein [Bacteroidales bacterium]
MDDLSRFRKFVKIKPTSKNVGNKNVWLYTRVSSSNQTDNYSLEYQKEEAYKYAQSKGLTITDVFGNTNESASDDFTRKEFTELIQRVRRSKSKPHAILVYVMNRFSRTGGNAIAIATELVDELGVNLIEVSSGVDTSTKEGRNIIHQKLLEANKQNLDRLSHTLPGMKKLIQSGKNLGKVPFGYDVFGPKVADFEKRSIVQKIVINEDGKKLRMAWEWKAQGMPDYKIIENLKTLGIVIRKQKLSAIWKKAFYCGIQTNALLEGICIKGNWEPLISEELFWKVQSMLNKNHHGYTVVKESEERPLSGFIYCSKCGKKLTGYHNKKKNLHYYKCQTCKSVSMNASTPKRYPNHIGANNLFVEVLALLNLEPKYEKLFELQLKKIFNCFEDSEKQEIAIFRKQLAELEKKKNSLEERYAFGNIEKEIYDKYRTKIEEEILDLRTKYEIPQIDTSNFRVGLNKALSFIQNISKYWLSTSVLNKERIQKLLFPQGLTLDVEKRQYLTSEVNTLFMLKLDLMGLTEEDKKKLPIVFDGESDLVAGTGLEPVAFGL